MTRQNCCPCDCLEFSADTFNADDWLVFWDHSSQPYGLESVAFNGADMTITLDWSNPAIGGGLGGAYQPIGVTLINRRWQAKAWDVDCPFYWSLAAQMEATNAPPTGCSLGGFPTPAVGVCKVMLRDETTSADIFKTGKALHWPEPGGYEWRINNATQGTAILDPQAYGIETYGFRVSVQPLFASAGGQMTWKIQAPLEVRVGCCEVLRHELPSGFTNAAKVFVFRTATLFTKANVVLTAPPYDPHDATCDPFQRYANQPQGVANVDLVSAATSSTLNACDKTETVWGGDGTLTIDRPKRWLPLLLYGPDPMTRMIPMDGFDPVYRFVAEDGFEFLIAMSPTQPCYMTAKWDSVNNVRLTDWTERGPYPRKPNTEVCGDTDDEVCGDNVTECGSDRSFDRILYHCEGYSIAVGESIARTCSAMPGPLVYLRWDRFADVLFLEVGNTVYTAPTTQLIGLDASGALTFTKRTYQYGHTECDCSLPTTLTLNVVSMT